MDVFLELKWTSNIYKSAIWNRWYWPVKEVSEKESPPLSRPTQKATVIDHFLFFDNYVEYAIYIHNDVLVSYTKYFICLNYQNGAIKFLERLLLHQTEKEKIRQNRTLVIDHDGYIQLWLWRMWRYAIVFLDACSFLGP